MLKVTPQQYKSLIQKCYEVKSPLYVYGGPGIGKSEIPRQVFSSVAKNMNKKYVEWNDLTLEQRKDCINNPDGYFVFCDQRVGQMDSTDLRGIPNLVKDTEMLECIPMSWIVYFTQEKAHGAIFFDELNLAVPTVAGQAYQIINERCVSDRRLGPDVFVFGAGNRPGVDQAYVHEMPFPLKDRFNEFELTPDVDSWVQWASGRVNPHMIAFIQWKSSYLYKVDESRTSKSSTPRGIVRASRLIDSNDITNNDTHMMISIACGEAFATEFQAYVKHYQQLEWNKIYKNPEMIEGYSVDKLWAIVGGMTEHFLKLDKESGKESQKSFDNIIGVTMHMKPDFAIVCLRMMRDSDDKTFKVMIKKTPNLQDVFQKYGKYIM